MNTSQSPATGSPDLQPEDYKPIIHPPVRDHGFRPFAPDVNEPEASASPVSGKE